uniref:sodium-independent sulfate anion transporter-like n=1 Tax=Styela clava TaxID=7725 RepID=UPI00193A9D25|nr:sodium-independent sulfate anion transporter-like [Styela clava]XP_039274512.1 sodium-independent sulfate anion transporter-like [Styela clava]
MPISYALSKSDSHIPYLGDHKINISKNGDDRPSENCNGNSCDNQNNNMSEITRIESSEYGSATLCTKTELSKQQKMEACCKSIFSINSMKKFLPITYWLPRYNLRCLRSDIIAGLAVGLTVIPQGLAYAAVAGLELQYGLYSAFMGCFIYCLFGTSKDITLGPTAIMSILVAEYARDPWKEIDDGDETSNVTLAILLTFTCGIIQVLMSIFRLGFLVHFISHPVIAGFTSAASVVIACSQIKKILGIHASSEFFHMWADIVHNIEDTKVWDVTMGVSCMLFLFILKKSKEKWGTLSDGDKDTSIVRTMVSKILWFMGTARNAIVVVLCSGIAYGITDLSLSVDERPITLTPNVTGGLPDFKIPNFSEPIPGTNETASFLALLSHLGSGLAVIPLMGILESIAISQAFARKNCYRVRPTQELLAIGISNFVGAFVGSYPITGSFSRTAVNSQSHVATPLGGLFTGIIVVVSLQFITETFQFIPSSTLGAVIIMAVVNMFDLDTITLIWKVHKIDLLPLSVTFFLCFWDLAYGIICGIGISLLILLASHARPRVLVEKVDNTLILKIRNGLDFPASDYLENQVQNHAEDKNCDRVVLDCKNITTLDFSAIESIYHCAEKFQKNGVVFVISALKPYLRGRLHRRGILSTGVKLVQCTKEVFSGAKTDSSTKRENLQLDL